MQINNAFYANYTRLSAYPSQSKQTEASLPPTQQDSVTESSTAKFAGPLPDISHMSEKFQQAIASGQLELVPLSPAIHAAMLAAQEANPTGYEKIIVTRQQRLDEIMKTRDMEDPFWVAQADLLRSDIEGFKQRQQKALEAQAKSTFSDHAPIAWRIARYDAAAREDNAIRKPYVSPNESGLLDRFRK